VSGDIVGRPAGAVLIPPQAIRFAALTGADPDRLVLNVTGWNKLVPRHHDAAHQRWLRRALSPATSAAAAAEAASRLGWPARGPAWAGLLGRAARHAPVLVHGDIHEDQLLADGGRLTGVLDWETARIDPPFWDFDFGEWGTGLWRRHRRDFSTLWAQGWHAYAQVRGLDTDSGPLETAFRLRHALALLADPGDPAVTGTPEEHLAHL
jgi:aminoglycoside phosphotransferase (APT) family kinase protein